VEKMSNLVVLIILLVGMLILSADAALSVSIGVTGLYDPDNTDDVTGELFLMLPHFWRLSSELGYGFTGEGFGNLFEMPPDRYQLLYSLVFSPELTKYAGPYLGAGFGYYKGEIPEDDDTELIEYQFGAPHFFGGVMFNLGRLSLRGGVRYVLHDEENPIEPGGLLYQASLMFSFGRRGKRRESVVSERPIGTVPVREVPDKDQEYEPPPEYKPPPEYERAKTAELVTVKLVSEEISLMPQGAVQRVLVRDDKKAASGSLVRTADKLILSLPDKPQLELPRLMETMVSLDGKTILQFGDEIMLTHPVLTDLFWVDRNGKVIRQLVNYYGGNAGIAMSNDGYTAIAGKLLDDPETMMMALYSPLGEEVWNFPLQKDQRIAQMIVASGGQHVAAIVTDSDKWLENHRIEIMDRNGRRSGTISGMGILQKIVLLGDGEKAFVQGYDTYGVVDIPSGELIWQRKEKIRMVSPYGATLDPDGKILFLMLADLRDRAEETYGWKSLALDSVTGGEMMVEYLPRKYPTTWDRIYEQVSASEIRILAGQQKITYSWEKREGGR